MSSHLTDEELAALVPSELLRHHTPIPTQVVSSDEFYPDPQNPQQREVEARLLAMADDLGRKQGMDRRRFFQTAAGMAASFVAMNEVYGPLFDAQPPRPRRRNWRRSAPTALKGQFIMDMHTHFLRDDTRSRASSTCATRSASPAGTRQLADKEQTHRGSEVRQLRQGDLPRQRHQDRADLVGAVRHPAGLVSHQRADGRGARQGQQGGRLRRLFSHMIFTPGQPGWLEKLDAGLALKPDSVKGYTVGDNTHKDISRYPWRMDDEKVAYKGYEKMVKAGIKNVCVHKGLFSPGVEKQFPQSARLRRRRRCRTGREGLAAAEFRHLPLRLSPRRRRSRRSRSPSSTAPAASPGSATSPTFRRSTASPTSTATSASCSRRRWSPSRTCARR